MPNDQMMMVEAEEQEEVGKDLQNLKFKKNVNCDNSSSERRNK